MARTKDPEATRSRILEEALNLFVEKGYDYTSIQDIINECGGLSKGAIYHHFKSKEDIFDEICDQIAHKNEAYFDALRDDRSKNGFEKLKAIFTSVYDNPNKGTILAIMDKVLREPKFFKNQILEIFDCIVPCYVLPVIEEGIRDGSLTGVYVKKYPKELAEMLMTLLNIWVNPVIARMAEEEVRQKIEFFVIILDSVGLKVFDEEMVESYIALCREYGRFLAEREKRVPGDIF